MENTQKENTTQAPEGEAMSSAEGKARGQNASLHSPEGEARGKEAPSSAEGKARGSQPPASPSSPFFVPAARFTSPSPTPTPEGEARGPLPTPENLGYLELLRAVPDGAEDPDPTDRVLNHPHTSVWDF